MNGERRVALRFSRASVDSRSYTLRNLTAPAGTRIHRAARAGFHSGRARSQCREGGQYHTADVRKRTHGHRNKHSGPLRIGHGATSTLSAYQRSRTGPCPTCGILQHRLLPQALERERSRSEHGDQQERGRSELRCEQGSKYSVGHAIES